MATKIIVKTPHEASGVPTMEANRAGLQATGADDQHESAIKASWPPGRSTRKMALIEREVHSVMESG
ncbi:hypothetical protein F2981_21675 (plasmid) [Sinorhizobium meliloti]|nr:hypothetical protein [Sinorhizobium meliloti]